MQENSHLKSPMPVKSGIISFIAALIFFLVPVFLAPILLGPVDQLYYYTWSALFIACAILASPLASYLFPYSPDKGWAYSHFLGFLIPAYLIWTLAYFGLPVFSPIPIRILYGLLSLGFIAYLFRTSRKDRKSDLANRTSGHPSFGPIQLAESGLFLLAFLVWTYVRTHKPEIIDLEKFMDYGFMRSMGRQSTLPAQDMWLSGQPINYYYFGQYLFSFMTKLSGIDPAYTYNLSVAGVFAMSFLLSFALIRDLAYQRALAKVKNKPSALETHILPGLGGLLGTLFLNIGGNSHAFFYKPGNPGHKFLRFLQNKGVEVGDIDSYFFSNATRFIGYNPETQDKTIHEFPYYSYLVADLHAHMVNLMVVLLLLGLLLSLYLTLTRYQNTSSAKVSRYQVLGLGLLLAVSTMSNYWDFLIYTVVICFAFFLIIFYRRKEEKFAFPRPAGQVLRDLVLALAILALTFLNYLKLSQVILQCLVYLVLTYGAFALCKKRDLIYAKVVAVFNGLFFLASFLSLPFQMHFDPMSQKLSLTQNQSGFYALFILWFSHVALALIFLIYQLLSHKKQNENVRKIHALVLAFGLGGLGLILAPEVLYVVDIYEGAFSRANTMFKFTYQAFLLLSVVASFSLTALLQDSFWIGKMWTEEKADRPLPVVKTLVCLLLSLLLFTVPFYYTPSVRDWYGDLKLESQKGLEGTRALAGQTLTDAEGRTYSMEERLRMIDFLNKKIEGQPVVLEAYGDSYSNYNVLSAYTGLPTPIGWQTHEWLWRTSKERPDAFNELVLPLQEDVRAIYEGTNPLLVNKLLRDHKVSYIVVGTQERLKFPHINENLLRDLGQVIYTGEDNAYILALP